MEGGMGVREKGERERWKGGEGRGIAEMCTTKFELRFWKEIVIEGLLLCSLVSRWCSAEDVSIGSTPLVKTCQVRPASHTESIFTPYSCTRV